jgi:hypothetical protein
MGGGERTLEGGAEERCDVAKLRSDSAGGKGTVVRIEMASREKPREVKKKRERKGDAGVVEESLW